MWLLIKKLCLTLLVINSSSLDQAVSGGPYTTIPNGDTGDIIRFYENWRNYLHLSWGTLHAVAGWFQNGIVKCVFHINEGFEKIFNAMFSLLGWDGTLTSSGSPLHGLYMVISAIGWALLVLAIIIVAMETMGHASKWSKILPNLIMVSLTLTILPMMMRVAGGNSTIPGLGDIAISARSDLNSASGKSMSEDLAVQPIKNNVIDLSTLIRKDWGNYKYKPDSSKIRNVANWNVLSSDDDIENMDLGDFMDEPTMKGLGLDKKHKDAEAVMNYHLVDEHEQDGGGYSIEKNDYHKFAKWMNSYYSRYSVNWLGLIGQSCILAIVLIVASFRVAKDIFELSVMNIAAPLIAAQSVRTPKKWRDFISSIVGFYLSIVLIVLILKVFFIFISVAPAKLPNMNWVERSLAIAVIYAAAGYAMFAGISYFERVTGVSQGFGEEAGQLMATGAVAGAAGGFAARMGGKAISFAGGLTSKSHGHGLTSNNSRTNGGNSQTNGLTDSNSTNSSNDTSQVSSVGNNNNSSQGLNTENSSSQANTSGLSEEQSQNSSNSQGTAQSTDTNTNNAETNGYGSDTSTSQSESNGYGSSTNTSQGQSSAYGQTNNGSYGTSQSSDSYQGNSEGSSSSYGTETNNTTPIDTVDNPSNDGLNESNTNDAYGDQPNGVDFGEAADDINNGNQGDSSSNNSVDSNEAGFDRVDGNADGLNESNWDSLMNSEPEGIQGESFQEQADQVNQQNDNDINKGNRIPDNNFNNPQIDNNDFSKTYNKAAQNVDAFNNRFGTNAADNPNFVNNQGGNAFNSQNNFDEGSVTSDYNDSSVNNHYTQTTQASQITRPNKVQRFGEHVTNLSKGVEQRSASYLKNRQFNLSQNGHIHGRDSEPFDDE